MANILKQLGAQDERWLRRWMLPHDPVFAMHRQLKDYFLADTTLFGTVAVYEDDGAVPIAITFWSRNNGRSYIHHHMGPMSVIEDIRLWLGCPCQLFVQQTQMPDFDATGWTHELAVTPGFVVDHPAYDGVFSRVAPRFAGSVYEHP